MGKEEVKNTHIIYAQITFTIDINCKNFSHQCQLVDSRHNMICHIHQTSLSITFFLFTCRILQLSIGFVLPPPSAYTKITNRYHFQTLKNVDGYSTVSCKEIPIHLLKEIQSVANELWDCTTTTNNNSDTSELLKIPMILDTQSNMTMLEGECPFNSSRAFSDRADYFKERALLGYPDAQHSYALLLHSGFGSVTRNAKLSAQFHAAAAIQGHLDGCAVLGGCLRKGIGVKRNVALGIELIEYCALVGNPTGVNKKGALLESNDDGQDAYKLYKACYDSGRINALLLFNLGWCHMYGIGVKKDRIKAISFWEGASSMAPDEGSEEAAWNLYQEYKRDDPKKAQPWLDLAVDLGYYEALEEIQL